MGQRSAEHKLRSGLFGPRLRLRVDLHGVSMFGPNDQHKLIRWEWIDTITVDKGVVVRSTSDELRFPRRAFELSPDVLAQRLEEARSINRRPEVIGQLLSGG